jgi:murein DD-endopeptidase MepM/ murein hydrolase activator NlpD
MYFSLIQINDAMVICISDWVNLTNRMTDLPSILRLHGDDFHAVVPFKPGFNKLISFDLTAANTALTADIVSDVGRFSTYIETQIREAGAAYGIGGYGEHRTVYGRSSVFDPELPAQEPRRLHLGLDVWGAAATPIFAPLAGEVHSFAFNNRYGDYGATIILAHQLEDHRFYSLYGHLSLADLEPLEPGMLIEKGTRFAHFGEPEENGFWPPHLHVQLIRDIGDARGDYPGVCRYSERHQYLSNCPDPDLVARLYRYL